MDRDRLRERLREMTVAQLRGRWKRIEARLGEPLNNLGAALLEHPELAGLREDEAWTVTVTQAQVLRQSLAESDPENGAENGDQLSALGKHGKQLALWALESEQVERADDLPALPPAFEVGFEDRQECLERARDLMVQRQLLMEELGQRDEPIPGQEPGPEAAPASTESEEPNERTTDLVERVGERVGGVAKGVGEKIAGATKSVAGGAARASGKAVWELAKSAFVAKPPATPKHPVPVRRRRPRQSSVADDSLALIERLFELKERGILNDEEFERKKSELLERL